MGRLAIATLALATGLAAAPAHGQEMLVRAVVADEVRIVLDDSGLATGSAATVPVTVTRKRVGDREIVTILPR